MKRNPLKYIISAFSVTFAFVLVLYLSVLLVFPKYFNSDNFCRQISDEFYKTTGLELNIEKLKLKPSFSPFVNINAHHIVIRENKKNEFLKVREAELKLKVLPLLTKTVAIEKITLERPVLSINVAQDGSSNIDKYIFRNYEKSAKTGIFTFSETIPKIEINRYKIKLFDKRYQNPFVIEGSNITTEKTTFKNNINYATKGVLSYNNEPVINYNLETEFPMKLSTGQKKLFNTNPLGYLKKYGIKSNVNAKLKLANEDKKFKINGYANIEALKFVIDGNILSDNYIRLLFNDNKIGISADIKNKNTGVIKVSGESTSGINPRLKLAVKSKDSDIKTLKEIAEAILNSFNIKNDLPLYIVSGKTDLDFMLESNYKTLKSSGIAKIINANIKHKNYPYEITNINSVFNFGQNQVKIEPSKLLINSTPVTISGSVDRKTNIDITAEGKNLDVEKLIDIFLPKDLTKGKKVRGFTDFTAKINGNLKTPKAEILSDLRNFTVYDNNRVAVKFPSGNIKVSGTKENPSIIINLNDANILPEIFANELTAENLKISASSSDIIIAETKFNKKEKPLLISGKIENIQKQPKYKFDINGNIRSESLYKILKEQKITNNIQAAPKGYLKINGQITGKNNDGSFKGTIFADKDNYLSAAVIKELLHRQSAINADIQYGKDFITINNLSLQNKDNNESIINIRGKIKNLQKPTAEQILINIPKSMTFAYSQASEITVKSNLEINGSLEKPAINGKLEIKNLSVPEYKVSSSVNEIIFSRDNIKINLPKVSIGNSKFAIKADMLPEINLEKPNIKVFSLDAEYIDLEELNETLEPAMKDNIYPGIALPFGNTKGTAKVKVFKTAGMTAENITCNIQTENNNVKITNIKGTAYKGTVSGKAEYNTLLTKTYCDLSGKNADIRSLMTAVTGVDDNKTGQVDYKLKINTIGTNKTQQQRTAKGYAEFTARNGVMGPLCQFEHFLYAQNLISQSILKMTVNAVSKVIKPKNTGVYTTANGIMEIKSGTADFKDLTIEGPNMSLYIQGKMNIPSNHVDLKIYGRISEEIEKFLGELKNPMPKTILSNSSETSLGNIFYDEYNTTVSREIMGKIPPLNPDTGLSARPFAVIIQGTPENIKAVKSFKWITGTSDSAEEKPAYNPHSEYSPQYYSEQKQNENKTSVPEFINNLPDYAD